MIWRIMQFEEGVLLALAGDTLQELHNFQIRNLIDFLYS